MSFVIISLIIFFTWQNNGVSITEYKYANSKLPKGFDSYGILQISDLHNKNFHSRLADKAKGINPDIIVITGDLIDRRNTRIDNAVKFVEQIVKIAPTYYVTGNHEQLSDEYGKLMKELERLKVRNIDNFHEVLSYGGSEIKLMGIADPSGHQTEDTYLWGDNSLYFKNSLKKLIGDTGGEFNILLSHRPEQFNAYKEMGVDLVFSGHAHGGQIRLPFIGGIIAPNQGFFPKFTQGVYSNEATSMVVSRGLGNSIFPLRIFNRPELVVVTLKEE